MWSLLLIVARQAYKEVRQTHPIIILLPLPGWRYCVDLSPRMASNTPEPVMEFLNREFSAAAQ